MITTQKRSIKRLLIAGVSALAIAAIAIPNIAGFSSLSDTAYAQGSGNGDGGGSGGSGGGDGGGSGGSGGGDGSGSGGSGSGNGGHDSATGSGHDSGSKGGTGGAAGKGGPDADSDGKGPQAGMGDGSETKGGQPSWAGAELTDIGRMNVIKSPDSVLQRAIDNLEYEEETQASLYSMSAAAFAAALVAANDLDDLIDSPVTNLALLSAYWDGTVELDGVTPASFADFSGILIGTAADKTSPVTVEQVEALLTITDTTLPAGVSAQDIADDAAAVQAAIVAIHG